jgi:hypothetical protein
MRVADVSTVMNKLSKEATVPFGPDCLKTKFQSCVIKIRRRVDGRDVRQKKNIELSALVTGRGQEGRP